MLTNVIVVVDCKYRSTEHPWQCIDNKKVHKREIFQCSTGFLKEEPPEIGRSYVSCSKTDKDEKYLPEHIHNITEILDDAKHFENDNCNQEYQVIERKCSKPVRSYLINLNTKLAQFILNYLKAI